jgi:hypothetical protein
LLASARPIDKAWGAYLAGRLNLTPLLPKLITELDRLRPIPTALDRENWSLAHTLLDALIELKAPLSFEQLKPWLENYANEALILLVQNAEHNQPELLELRPSLKRREHWLAVTNILVQQRGAGVVFALLSELKPESTLVAVDAQGYGGVGGGSFCSFTGCGVTGFAKDFPPAARYQIVGSAEPGDMLLAPGPSNVFLRRKAVPTNQQIGYSEPGGQLDLQAELGRYLGQLTFQSDDELRGSLAANRSIVWTTPEAFRHEAAQALQMQAGGLRELVNGLTRRELLSATERSALQLFITPKGLDLRKNPAEPMPTLEPYAVDLTRH